MRILDSHNIYSTKSLRLLLGLTCLMLFATQSVSGQDACPPPPGYVENPLSTPSITAAEVAANPTPDNLSMFALAARDYLISIGYIDQLQLAHASCLFRQEGEDWRSGGIFTTVLSFNPELAVNRQAPINMRVILHASHMAYGGRLVKPEIAGAILLAASSGLSTGVSSGSPVPGFGGHALFLGPLVLLVGLDLQEPHLDPHIIDSHHSPQVTAREVVDRASLKVFVNEAIHYVGRLTETHGFEAANVVRGAFRDRNGPWISGPVYLFMFDPTGYTIFHGAFPDRFEYRVTGAARDAVTGERILPQILAAAEQEGGGFVEYHFDNPDDDSDSAEIPKVTYARKFILSYHRPLLARPVSRTFIMAAGFYPGAGTGSG
ncbi:MAG: hypothetical protein OXC11_13100, partial [Rhodospirillales bacterium]|nr:hypothetical protein [Rhodospirillales bacterium]